MAARRIMRNDGRYRIGLLSVNVINRIINTTSSLEEMQNGGKIILPPSALNRISLRINQPLMIFRLSISNNKKDTFCGVISFDGEENEVLVPLWVMKQLQVNCGEKILVEFIFKNLEKGTFSRFLPLSKNFLEISNPRAVFEHCLRLYACLTTGDVISIYYNQQIYEFQVCQTNSTDPIIIVECDLQVDFAPMPEDDTKLTEDKDSEEAPIASMDGKFVSFGGRGFRLDGKQINDKRKSPQNENKKYGTKCKRGQPDYEYKVGTLTFKRKRSDLIPSLPSNVQRGSLQEDSVNQNVPIINGETQQMGEGNVPQPVANRPVTRSLSKMIQNQKNSSRDGEDSNERKQDKNDSPRCARKRKTS